MSVDDRDVCDVSEPNEYCCVHDWLDDWDVYVVHDNFSDFHVVGLDDCDVHDCLDGRDFHDLPWWLWGLLYQ